MWRSLLLKLLVCVCVCVHFGVCSSLLLFFSSSLLPFSFSSMPPPSSFLAFCFVFSFLLFFLLVVEPLSLFFSDLFPSQWSYVLCSFVVLKKTRSLAFGFLVSGWLALLFLPLLYGGAHVGCVVVR